MKYLLILSTIFYSILCIFSIVTGIIYMSGKRKLNPLELSDNFVKKIKDINKFTKTMGLVTFIIGIFQGLTAYSIYINNLYLPIGFTIFSILSVIFKLKNKINLFPILKSIAYIGILIVLIIDKIM